MSRPGSPAFLARFIHERYCDMLGCAAAVLLFCAVPAVAITLEVPKEVSFFEPPAIRVSGLPPLHPVTIRASFADSSGATFTSSAAFTPHTDGVVDTSRSIGNGDYHGVDGMGLFWSLDGKGPRPSFQAAGGTA